MNTKLEQIQSQASRFAAARLALVTTVQEYNDAQQLVKDKYWPKIKKLATETGEERGVLAGLIDASRQLFEDPRTLIADGIKFGLRKGKGKIQMESEEHVIERLESLFPAEYGDFIRVKKTIILESLNRLTAGQLKHIGVEISDAGDEVLIKPVDGDVEKLVAAVLKEAE